MRVGNDRARLTTFISARLFRLAPLAIKALAYTRNLEIRTKAGVDDIGKTSAQVVSAWWHDHVFVTIIAVAALFWLSALGLSVIKLPFLLHKFAIPFAVSLYGQDQVPRAEAVQRFLSILAEATALVGGLTLAYACLWRYLFRRLPTGAASMRLSTTGSVSILEGCSLAAVFVLAVILRLYHITRGLTLDELTTVTRFVDIHSLWTTLSTDNMFNNHLANSLLAYLSQRLLGRSEWVLRLPALLCGLTSVYVLWAFTRRLAGSALAVLATVGLALSPAHIYWSVTARGYTGMLLFTLISTWLYWQILHDPSWRKGLLFILSSVLAIFFHLFAVLVVLTQLVFFLYLAAREMTPVRSGRILSVDACRMLYLSFPVIAGMSLACYAPILPQYIANFRASVGHGVFNLLLPLEILRLFSYGRLGGSWVSPPEWVLLSIMGGLCAVGWFHFHQKSAHIANYWACLGSLPLLIVMPARPYYLDNRFFFFLLPFYLILVGEGLLTAWRAAKTPTAPVSRTVLQSCCVLMVGAMLGTWLWKAVVDEPRRTHGFRAAAWTMEREATSAMGLCSIGWAGRNLQYYLNRDLFIPRNWEDFDQFVRRYPAFICADTSPASGDKAHVSEIADFLAQHAASQRFYNIIVYTYKTTP